MQDERIQTTVNRLAAIGFFVCYVLISISLCYRTYILKQPIRDYWDIAVIFTFCSLFVSIAYASKGVFAHHNFKRMWLTLGIFLFFFLLALKFIRGQIHSVGDLAETVAASLLGLGVAIGITYFLTRRWQRKEGLEEEK